VPALKTQSLEFKLHSHQNKTKKQEKPTVEDGVVPLDLAKIIEVRVCRACIMSCSNVRMGLLSPISESLTEFAVLSTDFHGL
jgi:hypothetical protein